MDAAIALLGLGTGVAVLATAVITLVLSLKNKKQVKEVHVLVNSRMVEMVTRVDQLAAVLEAAGMDVPPPSESDQTP